MAHPPPPPLPSLNAAQLEELLARLRIAVPLELFLQVEPLLRVLFWILQVLAEKKISLGRLRDALFRSRNEKTSQLFAETADPAAPEIAPAPRPKRQGHGRQKATDYPGARRVSVPHPTLRPGQLCPKCGRGKLCLQHPARLLSMVAQPIFDAILHELERLRCALCGAIFTAPAPQEAAVKYDPSVGVMLALLRYGAGLPMYRIAKWQIYFGAPLPASTQWELIDAAAQVPELIYEQLIQIGAQSQLVHNDDTSMRVQSVREEIAAEEPGGRTGIFTTSLLCQAGAHRIALFLTGRKHAGENLEDLLQHRAAELEDPLQMSDALARNRPGQCSTQQCHCLAHGRRNFVDQIENFPEECRQVLESIRLVYQVDEEIKEASLTPAERLQVHQTRSAPVMAELRQWMNTQLAEKKVEPNSGLGKAINYMLNHWEPLTRFLQVAGAPLDNNICERALKMAILHRKNSLCYKTARGARVGDIFMSLIHTCELNSVNPFDYLNALQKHAAQARHHPELWLPWNYQQANAPLTDTG